MNSPRLATIGRRMFLGGLGLGVLAASFAAEAQQTTRRPLVGFLCNTMKLARAFGEGLRELGYVDGRNIFVEYRCAEGRMERGPDLAAALLRLKPDLLVSKTNADAVSPYRGRKTFMTFRMPKGSTEQWPA